MKKHVAKKAKATKKEQSMKKERSMKKGTERLINFTEVMATHAKAPRGKYAPRSGSLFASVAPNGGPSSKSTRFVFSSAASSAIGDAKRVLLSYNAKDRVITLRPTKEDDARGFRVIGIGGCQGRQRALSSTLLLRFIGVELPTGARIPITADDGAISLDLGKPITKVA